MTERQRTRYHSRTYRRRQAEWRRVIESAEAALEDPLDEELRAAMLRQIAARIGHEGVSDLAAIFEGTLSHAEAIENELLAEALQQLHAEARRRVRDGLDDAGDLADALGRLAKLPALHSDAGVPPGSHATGTAPD